MRKGTVIRGRAVAGKIATRFLKGNADLREEEETNTLGITSHLVLNFGGGGGKKS